jgi:hypothetical protein
MEGWGDYPDTLPRTNPHAERIARLEAEHAELMHFWRQASGKTAQEAMRAIAKIGGAIDDLKAFEVE